MSDTWRQNAIVQAIQIIADKKIAQAGYDKTRKGIISQIIDKTSGKYRVKYQDSQFQAYATSSNVYYEVGQLVSFLVPGNDWSREITIINGVKNYATNYTEVPEASQLYNKTGPSAVKSEGVFGLCSYKTEEKSLIEEEGFFIDQQVGKTYIPQGNGLVIGMDVQTSLDSGQVNGNYGLRFDLVFRNIQTGSQNDELDFSQGGAAVRSYFVTDRDVIGNPYGLTKTTTVEHLLNIDDINPADFIKIKDIVAYCNDFPQGQDGEQYSNDIFFSNIHINGVKVLSDQDLNGYVVHIDYSETGQILDNNLDLIKLQASLKVNGKKVTSEDQLSYYWFRQNGLIFRNSPRYSSYGGDGWECLNNFTDNGKVIKATNTIYFTNSESKIANTPLIVGTLEKNTRVKCVVVYQYKETSGFQNVIDNTKTSFYIDSNQKQTSDNINKIDYYLDYGMPSLTCLPQEYKQGDNLSNYTFSWSVVPARGQAIQIQEIDDTRYKDIKDKEDLYDKAQKQIEKVPQADQDKYKEATGYQAKVDNYEEIKNVSYVKDNVYYNFPISSIINYSKIICSVHEGDIYKGSASITLYNHTQVPSTYSLNIENSTQVFQYDGKGNSPTSPQLEKPLQIKPLSFTLIDDEGNQVSYQQIINNGYVEWIVPIQNTLLISDEEKNGSPLDDTLLIGTDRTLAASLGYEVNIYKASVQHALTEHNFSSFVYKIADTYDSKKVNNNIRLDVKYKDMLFTAYTDFTFPKDGDPGTNGTDYVAKLIPINDKEEVINTDRLYVDSKGDRYTDNGNQFDKLKFQLYNNSNVVDNTVNFWTCPPKTTFDSSHSDVNSAKHYINVNSEGKITRNIINYDVLNDKVVDIVRAQNGTGNNIKYFAQYPICFSYLNNNNYRFKVRPKTGFKYVVYAQDGTSPDYDKTLPFEIVVEEYKGYYIQTADKISYQWDIVNGSYLQIDNKLNENNNINISLKTQTINNKCYFKPKDKFISTDLFSAIVVKIKKDNTELGWIHIPIYMIINRYGHSALNSWDGNTVQIDKDGNGSILAPQVAAGTKDNTTNTFTGVLMGQIAVNSNHGEIGSNGDIGIMGYHQGQRSIFLDSKTGKAEFGKQGAAKIILDPSQQMNGKDVAFLYSNGFNKNLYKENNGESKKDSTYGSGLMIDLTSPAIQFGTGNFYVNSSGHIHAAGGGDIAGWFIDDNKIYKGNTGMSSQVTKVSDIDPSKSRPRQSDTVAFYAGQTTESGDTKASPNFYVTHKGYLFSKSGRIAKWDIDKDTLTDGNVGMGTNPNTINFTYNVGGEGKTAAITDSRIWSGNKFVVTNSGKIYAKDGQIGPWTVGDTSLTNGYVGLGYNVIDKSRFSTSNNITARIWSGAEGSQNFAVTNGGALYSRSGKIGGWNIESNKLWSVNPDSGEGKAGIRLNANGSMSGGKGYNSSDGTSGSWSIATNGRASFTGITASQADIDHAMIDTATVTNGYISTGYFGTSGSKITIDNSGIHGTGFDITPTYTHFDGLKVDSGGISTSSGGTISGGGSSGGFSLSGTGGSVGGCSFGGNSSTGYLAVDTLQVGGTAVTWQKLKFVTKVSLKYHKLSETVYVNSDATPSVTVGKIDFNLSAPKDGGAVTGSITKPTVTVTLNKTLSKIVTQIDSCTYYTREMQVLGAENEDSGTDGASAV